MKRINVCEESIVASYISGKGAPEIARALGVESTFIYRCLSKHGIPRRSREEARVGVAVSHGLLTNRRNCKNFPEYRVWVDMRKRCYNPRSNCYKNYGGRGIKVCDKWKAFAAFFEDMGARPSPKHSLERIDNNGPYSPDNCSWAKAIAQHNNKRTNRVIEFDGRRLSMSMWAREAGLPLSTLRSRLNRAWSVERAITEPRVRVCDPKQIDDPGFFADELRSQVGN